ncbi:hypothetical protein B0H13DRAFT_1855618 [Mycena leptocephala]|nr:hypothetical protein B0H13DRAFT_1855618 [Mycena leptocephala]
MSKSYAFLFQRSTSHPGRILLASLLLNAPVSGMELFATKWYIRRQKPLRFDTGIAIFLAICDTICTIRICMWAYGVLFDNTEGVGGRVPIAQILDRPQSRSSENEEE